MVTRSESIADKFMGSSLKNGWPDRVVETFPPTAVEYKYNGQGLFNEQVAIANLLVKAGWRYIVLTVRKDDSIYLWDFGAQEEITVDEFKALVANQSAGGVM